MWTKEDISEDFFLRIWNDLLPFIKYHKSATDRCWYCQQRSIQMQRSVNQPDSLKSLVAPIPKEKQPSETGLDREETDIGSTSSGIAKKGKGKGKGKGRGK